MSKDYEKLFSQLKPAEPPVGLFERIIFAIRQEQELQHARKLLFGFLFLLIISFMSTFLSFTMLINQLENSGIIYFVSAAVSNLNIFLNLWQDFGFAILESLPILGIVAFCISIGIAIFSLRLFLYRKKLLLNYLFLNLKVR